MKRIRVRVLGGAVVLLLVSVALTQQPVPRPVATVTQLMQAMMVPASNALFNVPRQVPEDDAGWDAVRNHAVILAESGNLLMIGERAEDSEVWLATSQALADAGEAALEAALARDVEAIMKVGDQIIDACERCHEKHWIR